MKNNRSKKVITDDIRNNFFKMLDDFASSEPDQKRKKDSATSLIIERRAQIVELIEKGYAVEQIILGMAKINLEISASTLRSTLRTTDEDGNRIAKAKAKGKQATRKAVKSTASSSESPPENTQGDVVESIPTVMTEPKSAMASSNTEKFKVDAPDKLLIEALKVDTQGAPPGEPIDDDASYAEQVGVVVPISSKREPNNIKEEL